MTRAIAGSAEARVLVCTPPPGMLKLITRGFVAPAFAGVIASRSEPEPGVLSSVFVVTKNVFADPAAAKASSNAPTRKAMADKVLMGGNDFASTSRVCVSGRQSQGPLGEE